MNKPADDIFEEDFIDEEPQGEFLDDEFGEEVQKALEAQEQADTEGNDETAEDDNEKETKLERFLKLDADERKAIILNLSTKIDEARNKRAEQQSEVNSQLAKAETKGLNKAGYKAGLDYIKMDQKKKDAYLFTFFETLKAHDIMVQKELEL